MDTKLKEIVDDIAALSGRRKAIFIVVILVVLIATCDRPEEAVTPPSAAVARPSEQTRPSEQNRSEADVALMACIAAQREVKKHLKAPATADFPDCGFSLHEYKITANDEMTKVGVQGYVDSENSFGANIRSNFVVLFDKSTGDGSSAFTPYKVAVE
ncbi:MAG: hypothetical protein WKG03_21660 [Telluria sp.]